MMKKSSFLIIVFLIVQTIHSQTIIKGNVKDLQNNSLSNINVFLKLDNENDALVFTKTDQKGYYELVHNVVGTYQLTFTSISFEKVVFPLKIEADTHNIKIDVVLKPTFLELSEVIVIKAKPIIIKKDTIVYNVASFNRGNEQVVEDVLKNLPGITVESNGTIKIGNKEVEKIMIEGDDFFEEKYKLLSKNMPSFTIDQVEVIQKYSENKLLKNIESSNKVALNLKLVENFKKQWFGTMYGANNLIFNSNNRHQLNLNIINIGKKNKYYFLADLNNIGQDYTSTEKPSKEETNAIFRDNLIITQKQTPNLKLNKYNFNNQKLFSLNAINTLTKKLKFKTNAFLISDNVFYSKSSTQNTNVNSINFQNIENSNSFKDVLSGNVKIDLTIDISKQNQLESSTSFNFKNLGNFTTTNFNDETVKEMMGQRSFFVNQELSITHKINDKSAFLLSTVLLKNDANEHFFTSPFLYNLVFDQDAIATNQTINRNSLYNAVEGKYILKQNNENMLELAVGNFFESSEYQTQFDLLNDQSVIYPADFQNNLRYNTNDLFLKSKYIFNYKKVAFSSSLSVHNLSARLNDLNQNFLLVNSDFGASFKFSSKNIVVSSISYNTKNTNAIDVLPNYYNERFRNFTKGMNSIDRLATTSLTINHLYGNWADKFSANSLFIYTKDFDFISFNSYLTQNAVLNDKVLLKGRESFTFLSSVNQYLKPISSNLKLSISSVVSNNRNKINEVERAFSSTSLNYGLEIRSAFKGKAQINLGSKWSYNLIDTGVKSSFNDNISFLDFVYSFNSKVNVKIQSERYFFGNLDKNNNQYYFLDFECRYTLQKNKIAISIIGNNLLNTNNFRDFYQTDSSTINSQYQLQPRFAMLKFEFRLP